MRSDTFLSMFRVLEGLLTQKYQGCDRHSASVVMEYINDPESEPVRTALNTCREIRNLLTHNADEDGQPLVEPSQSALDSLYQVIRYVQKPQPALMYATPVERVLRAYPNDRALDVMRRMEKHGFSHVPVMDDVRMRGVFSVRTVFSYILTGGRITEDTRVREFGDLLSMDGNRSGRYRILGVDASYLDVRSAFERNAARNDRLAVVFLTDDGTSSGTLLGMLTPWDVLNDNPV